MFRRYEVSARRRDAFARREGEDSYGWVARQICMARPHEVAWLYMLRNDDGQREAMQLVQAARTAFWSRLAVFAVLVSVPVNAIIALAI